jgi:hypothetical protein
VEDPSPCDPLRADVVRKSSQVPCLAGAIRGLVVRCPRVCRCAPLLRLVAASALGRLGFFHDRLDPAGEGLCCFIAVSKFEPRASSPGLITPDENTGCS